VQTEAIALKWRFPQENATLRDARKFTVIVKTP
jgi:hypothetical protein